ncbi:hypothetical protein [Leptospira sp. GIMC2001]|uniref:hypothetical protein n=1 Tax=Leptospira sp. GIMC2001 TaxID=1513297 RepID=UPI0023490ED7|nr:hypothetical protein [Leptospira sp. GIMC2001]WCL50731.1 hypothetical protein O4O04_07945 [Leptospira sp. GIMC2001]
MPFFDTKDIAKIGIQNGISKKQINGFQAFVDIDNLKESPLGFQEVFKSFCESGNSNWLNPSLIWNRLDEILAKFQADRSLLHHFRDLLAASVRIGLSPHSFFKYVISPRLSRDYDWRSWEVKHIPAFHSIIALIATLKEHERYKKDQIEGAFKILSSDIVLTKYIAYPIAHTPIDLLSNSVFCKSYIDIWLKIQFSNPLFFHFLKLNIFPILKKFSAVWSTNQITSLLKKLPELEATFQKEFSQKEKEWRRIPKLSIYSIDFEHGFLERKKSGFNKIDYYREISSFINILQSLATKRVGIFFLDYLGRRLVIHKDPKKYEAAIELIQSLKDRTGLSIYFWHFRKFFKMKYEDREKYPKFISENDGMDPEYKIILDRIFDEELITDKSKYQNHEYMSKLQAILKELKMDDLFHNQNVSPRLVLKEFLKKSKLEVRDLIQSAIDDCLDGNDRSWHLEKCVQLDRISKNLFFLFKSYIIRGFSAFQEINWLGHKNNSSSFNHHWEAYKDVHKSPSLRFFYDFLFKKRNSDDTNKKQEEVIRQKINIDNFEYFHILTEFGASTNINTFFTYFQKKLLSIRKSIQELKNHSLEVDKSELNKIQKSILHLERKHSNLVELLELARVKNGSLQKILLIILFPNFFSIKDQETKEFYQFLIESNSDRKELEFLNKFIFEDVVIDRISLPQIESICRIVEEISQSTMQEIGIKENISDIQNSEFFKLLKPYSLVKSKELNVNAIDAAIKKLFNLNKMIKEKDKWIDSVHSKESTNSNPLFQYRIVLNKSPLDSYYGTMGGICLAQYPKLIIETRLFNFRIVDLKRKDIMGSMLGYYINTPIPKLKIDRYLSVFAINPLLSFLTKLGGKDKILFYLHIRKSLEEFAKQFNIPILLAGADGTFGLISEYPNFSSIILKN